MSAFLIYATILTLIYIIYYSAMITREMYGKKGQTSDTAETFDFSDMTHSIESVNVEETKDGFHIGNDITEKEVTLGEMTEKTAGKLTDETDNDDSVADADGISEAEMHAGSVEAQMEEIEVDYSDPVFDEEYEALLMSPGNAPVIITTNVRDEL